jgi:DNA-binding SARP family transcriptional activator/Tfp pilus assembly protein PilF
LGLYLSLLGPPQLFEDGRLVSALPRKAAVMAAYLAVHKTRVERILLADLLWEGGEEAVRRNLRQELFRLKGTPWERVIEQGPQHLALGAVETDLEHFLAYLARGNWGEAAALWRGGFLGGLDPKGSENLWDWLVPERERWERLYHEAMLGQARHLEAAGAYPEALAVYRELLAQDPLQEAEQGAALRLLALTGDYNGALRQYEEYRRLLAEQLGLEPSPEIAALHTQLRTGALPRAGVSIPRTLAEPPLVGRAADWAWLEAHWGRGLLLLTGEPGVGKSRLVLEFARRKGEVLRVPQRESNLGLGFGGLLEVLRQAFETGKLPGNLEAAWLEELAQVLPELGLPPAQPNKARLFEALARSLQALVRPGGVVVWEDLQWLDWASLEFLPYLVRRSAALGLFVLGTGRPELAAPNAPLQAALRELRGEARLYERGLGPLGEAALLELLRAMSGQSKGAERFARRLYQATEGNAFYVLETVRFLFDQGLLRVEGEEWRTPFDEFTADYRELPLPPSVREALLGRLSRLGEGALALIRAVALADFPLPSDLAVGLLPRLGAGIGDLEALWAGGFIRQDPLGYSLRHELVRQAVLSELSEPRRQWLHRALAETLRDTGGEPWLLAQHLEASGQRTEAYQAYLAAARALRRGPLARQALEYYARAQTLCPPMEAPAERFRALVESAEARVSLGQLVIPERAELTRLAAELGTHERYRLSLLEAEITVASGNVRHGIEAAREAMRLAQTPWQRGHALFRLAWLEYRGGDPNAQLQPLLESIAAFHDIGDGDMEARALRNLSGYWFRIGDLQQFESAYARAWELAVGLEEGMLLRRLKADKALIDLVKGDYAPALATAQALYTEARERGDWWAVWDSLQLLLLGAAVFGLEPTLEATVRGAMLEAEGIEARRDLALLRLDLGMALLTQNRLEEAQSELEAALEEFRRIGERAMLGHSLFFLGCARLEGGDPQQAQQFIEESVAIWKDRKEYRHQARALAGLSLALLRRGQPEAARRASAEAYALRAEWARGLYDLPLVLYARARSLGEEAGTEFLRAAQTLLQEESRALPSDLGSRLLNNRFVAWVLTRRAG